MEQIVTLTEKKHKFRMVDVNQLVSELKKKIPQINNIQLRSLRGINKFIYVDCNKKFNENTFLDILLKHTPNDKQTIREAYTLAETTEEKLEIMSSIFLDQYGHYEIKE